MKIITPKSRDAAQKNSPDLTRMVMVSVRKIGPDGRPVLVNSWHDRSLPPPAWAKTVMPSPESALSRSKDVDNSDASHSAAKKMPKKVTKAVDAVENAISPNWVFMTVKQTSERYPSFSQSSLRYLIYQAMQYSRKPNANLKSSGFEQVIRRVPGQRRVLIDDQAFNAWVQSGQPATASNK